MSNTIPRTENGDRGALSLNRDEQHASDWASSPLSDIGPSEGHAIDPFASAEDEPTQPPSTDPTPGVIAMPGGLPLSKQHEGEVTKDVEYVKPAAFGTPETAKQTAQSATQSAQGGMQAAGEKVGGYPPASVAPHLPHALQEVGGQQSESEPDMTKTSTLPSEEVSQNSQPSSEGGVGTLPGPPGEIGVAVLPEERTEGKSVVEAVEESVKSTPVTNTSPIMSTTNNNPIPPPPSHHHHHGHPPYPLSRHTGFIPSALQDDTSLAKLPEERRLEMLPSHDGETGGRLGKSGGVGALPGSANESSVALLPDERKLKEREESKDSEVMAAASTDRGGQPLHEDDSDPSRLPDEIEPQSIQNQKDEDNVVVSASTNGDSPPKKLGFMDKVKGEMKILSGKMSHTESKVEEGRKMMGKN